MPDDQLEDYAKTLRDPQLNVPTTGAVSDAAVISALVQSTPGLKTADDILNMLQYTSPAVPPKYRATVNSLDPTSLGQHFLTRTGRDNTPSANDYNTQAASKWIVDAYYHDFPSRDAQQAFNR